PSRFSHAAAITSTPIVIQFSMISFCLAGSGFTGPSYLKVAPSSVAALFAPFSTEMKNELPLLFGMNAMVMGLPLPVVLLVEVEGLLQPINPTSETTSSRVRILFIRGAFRLPVESAEGDATRRAFLESQNSQALRSATHPSTRPQFHPHYS